VRWEGGRLAALCVGGFLLLLALLVGLASGLPTVSAGCAVLLGTLILAGRHGMADMYEAQWPNWRWTGTLTAWVTGVGLIIAGIAGAIALLE
jgi:hypothetical protein